MLDNRVLGEEIWAYEGEGNGGVERTTKRGAL